MEQNAAYLDWLSSPHYHHFREKEKAKETQTFISQLIQHIHPRRGSRVLDTACGQGQACMHITSLGFDVTGVDMSTTNIELARKQEQNNPEFYQHDLRLPFWGNYFQLAFSLEDSFGYYRTRRENEAAFRTIASSLQPGGLFVIDYPNSHYIANRQSAFNHVFRLGEIEYRFELTHNDTHYTHKIAVTHSSQNESTTYQFERTKLSLDDFTEMLAYQKMKVKEVFGDHALNAYHLSDTPCLIIVAEKK